MEAGMSASVYGSPALAYVGDAYFELLVREKALSDGGRPSAQLNRMSRKYVTAVAQSALVNSLLPLLTEEESAVYRRGRNSNSAHPPKSAGAVEYRRATGLECLFGWLYLSGREQRARELFSAITQEV
ncbi:MAG: Mini-ribonuclease 3 [Eubacteriales bacterium]